LFLIGALYVNISALFRIYATQKPYTMNKTLFAHY